MAKQTKAIIAKRITELTNAGLPSKEMQRPDVAESIVSETAGNWPAFALKLVEDWKNSQIPLTEAEHIPQEAAAPVAGSMDIATRIEKEVETGIATFDANKVTIAEWKAKYAGLTFSGDLKDTENINMIMEGWRVARTTRLSIEKREDFLKAPLIAGSKKIGGVAAEYYTLLGEIETPMKKQRDLIEAAKEEEKNKAALAAEAEGKRRVEVLKEAGMSFDGSFYVIGETRSADYSSIKAMPPDEFESFLGKVIADKAKLDEAEADRLKAMKAERQTTRGNMLVSIGMVFAELDGKEGNYTSEHLQGTKVLVETLTDEADDKFMTLFSSLSTRIADAKKLAEEELTKKAKERTVALRSRIILGIGMEKVDYLPKSTQTGFYFKNEFAECQLTLPSVGELSDEDFDTKLEEFEALITEAKAAAVTKEEKDKAAALLTKERGEQLVALGMTIISDPGNLRYEYGGREIGRAYVIKLAALSNASADEWNTLIEDAKREIKFMIELKKEQEEKEATEKKEKEEKAAADLLIFQERQNSLLNLGMMIVGNAFTIKNEFGNIATIGFEEVKTIDADAWTSRISDLVTEVYNVKLATIEKRKEAIDKLEAAKPEAEKFKAYMMAILEIPHPQIKDAELLVIWQKLEDGLTDALGTASAEVDRKINAAQPVTA